MRKETSSATDKDNLPAVQSGAPDARPHRALRLAGRALCVLLLILAVLVLIASTSQFAISDISVSGNNYYSKNQIVSKSGLAVGQNGFMALRGDNIFKVLAFRCPAAEQAVAEACPYVKAVQIRYVLPRDIQIEIEERTKSVVVPYFGSGLLIDGEGVVVDIISNYRQSELPVAQGLSVTRYEVGKTLATGDSSGIETVLMVVNALRQVDRDSDESLTWKIAVIDVNDPKNIQLGISGGINVSLGDGTELYYRVSAVKEILDYGLEDGETGEIIFSNGARPVFVPDTNTPI